MTARTIVLRDAAGVEHPVSLSADGTATVHGETLHVRPAPDGSLHLASGTCSARAWTVVHEGLVWVFVDGQVHTFPTEARGAQRRRRTGQQAPLTAPMPAAVRKVFVSAGDEVRGGDLLVVLEAMKMELPVRAAADGRVRSVACREGDTVQQGHELVVMD